MEEFDGFWVRAMVTLEPFRWNDTPEDKKAWHALAKACSFSVIMPAVNLRFEDAQKAIEGHVSKLKWSIERSLTVADPKLEQLPWK